MQAVCNFVLKAFMPIFSLMFLFSCGGDDSGSSKVTPNIGETVPSISEVSSIVVEWLDNSNNEDGFMIERRIAEGADFTAIKIVTKDATSYTDSGIFYSESYYCYKVTAFNQSGVAPSEEVCIDTY